MTYYKLYEEAICKLDRGEINLDEFDEMIKPLHDEVRPTGHWIDDGFYAEGHSHKAFHCSKCGHNVLGFKEDLSKFCPNCGCAMVEPQESEDKE